MKPAGYDALAQPGTPQVAAVGSDGEGVGTPFVSPDRNQKPKPGAQPKPFDNRGKGQPADEVPDRVRVLKDVMVSTQSGAISFVEGQVIVDKHLIAALMNSDASLEPF